MYIACSRATVCSRWITPYTDMDGQDYRVFAWVQTAWGRRPSRTRHFCGQAGAPSCLCLLSLAERWSSCLLPLVWTNRNRAARLKQRHQLCSWVCTLGCQLCFIIFPIPFARLHQVMVIFGEATELLQKLFSNASRRSALKLRKWVSKVGLPKMSFQKKFEHLRDRFF
jgi:hypothetical protein